jgi:hypothetical protein
MVPRARHTVTRRSRFLASATLTTRLVSGVLGAILRSAAVTLVLASVALPAGARAQGARIGLAVADPELVRAVSSALEPWEVAVLAIDVELGAAMPEASDTGLALAREHDVAAIVWISSSASGPALWMYDRETERVVSRRLAAGPPFDEPSAAAIALSIKTLLRHSAAAPPSERLVPLPTPGPAMTRLEIAGGLRTWGTVPADVEPRAGIALALWPDPAVGGAIAVRSGTGIPVSTASFAGRWMSIDLVLGGRLRWAPIEWLDLGVLLELGATLGILQGDVLPSVRSTSWVEIDPTGSLALELGTRPLPALRVGVRIGAQGTPRTRSYLVRGQRVLETTPVQLVADLVIEIPLDGRTVLSR